MTRTVEHEDSKAIFAANLDRYLRLRGIQNPWVANRIRHENGKPVSRQAVHQWRTGDTYPGDDLRRQLYRVLQCTETDLTQPTTWIAANLRNLMAEKGMASDALAASTDLPLSEIEEMLSSNKPPSKDALSRLAEALACSTQTITEASDFLSISMWAKREDIPITRAEALFDLKLLSGLVETPFCRLVPTDVVAPPDSKQLVASIKRWPYGGLQCRDRFIANLKFLMSSKQMDNTTLAGLTGVQTGTISHWRSGIRTPEEANLKQIAAIFEVELSDLMTKDLANEA